MRNIIVISGKQGSGKSTQAEMLQAIALKDGFVPLRARFSEVLYELHNVCLPLLKKYGIRDATMEKDGELLQVLGTEYGRTLHTLDKFGCLDENIEPHCYADEALETHKETFE